MGILTLQRSAFIASPDFNGQVSGFVAQHTLSKSADWAAKITPQISQLLANIVRTPHQYGFVQAMVNDDEWFVTYDPWAENPSQWNPQIEIYVEKHWTLLTGIVEPVPPAEPAP